MRGGVEVKRGSSEAADAALRAAATERGERASLLPFAGVFFFIGSEGSVLPAAGDIFYLSLFQRRAAL